MPAGELVELRPPDADGVLVSYRVPCGLIHALLRFSPKGKRPQFLRTNDARELADCFHWPYDQAIRRHPSAVPMFKSLAAMNAFEAVHLATLSHGFGAPVDGAAFA
jgi:hypothetical protein